MLQTVSARMGRLFKKRRRTEGLRAAVAISDTEIAVALVRKLDGQRPQVLRIVVEEARLGFADPVLGQHGFPKASHFLQKPFSAADLLLRVNQILAG